MISRGDTDPLIGARLALGTAQFGSSYGVCNKSGQVGKTEIARILRLACEAGIDTLDTAVAYGASETALGEAGVENWKLVTKLPAVPDGTKDWPGWVEEQVDASLNRLGVESLYGLLLHQPSQLLERNGERLAAALEAIKTSGKTRKIGVSIYDPAQLGELLTRLRCDLVQAPLNVLDRRLVETGWCARLKEAGIEVHARSVFLQGLLLITKRPNKFNRWNAIWEEWDFWLQQTGRTPLEACLRYASGCEGIGKIVVGVDSIEQLRQILSAGAIPVSDEPQWSSPPPAELIDPSRWPSL